MFYQIKNRWTDAVLFEGDFGTMKLCVEAAVKVGANLDGANLNCANLNRANLNCANLNRASLDGASLDGANLNRANLDGASLDSANLNRANLDGANLNCANLDGANLNRANLDGANLNRASLDGASLDGANLNRASLDGASLRDGIKVRALRKVCTRTDGHTFHLWDCEDGLWRVTAGCRFFTLPQAWKHWTDTRDGTPLGEETFDILVMFEHQAERDDAARAT